jgi:hypothetical protein
LFFGGDAKRLGVERDGLSIFPRMKKNLNN